MENYKLVSLDDISLGGRVELHEQLNLTGAEISFNVLPKSANVPFVHKHKENEEIYYILEGKGYLSIDTNIVEIKKGDAFKINPEGKRCIKASDDSSISYMCIQVKENSLNGFTQTDGVILADEPIF